jgi:hypothetical protein
MHEVVTDTEWIARKLTPNGIGTAEQTKVAEEAQARHQSAETQMSSGQPTNNPFGSAEVLILRHVILRKRGCLN